MTAWLIAVRLTGLPSWGTWTPNAVYAVLKEPDEDRGFWVADNKGHEGWVPRSQAKIIQPPSPLVERDPQPGRVLPISGIVKPGDAH